MKFSSSFPPLSSPYTVMFPQHHLDYEYGTQNTGESWEAAVGGVRWSRIVNCTCCAAEGCLPLTWALEKWQVTERKEKGKKTAGTKGTRGVLPRLGGSPWSRRKAGWRRQDAGPQDHHHKGKGHQSLAQSSLGFGRCFWGSMRSARSCRRCPSCQETHLCKANPHHTHVSP